MKKGDKRYGLTASRKDRVNSERWVQIGFKWVQIPEDKPLPPLVKDVFFRHEMEEMKKYDKLKQRKHKLMLYLARGKLTMYWHPIYKHFVSVPDKYRKDFWRNQIDKSLIMTKKETFIWKKRLHTMGFKVKILDMSDAI